MRESLAISEVGMTLRAEHYPMEPSVRIELNGQEALRFLHLLSEPLNDPEKMLRLLSTKSPWEQPQVPSA